MSLLSVEAVVKRYGSFLAVDSVSLDLSAQEVLAIIGPNGAGKSSLFGIIGGQLAADSGSIRLAGHDVSRLGPSGRAELGLTRTFQVARLFESFSVGECVGLSMAMGARQHRGWRNPQKWNAFGAPILDLIGLEAVVARPVTSLTQGQRKRLELGLAIASEFVLLVLDEPTAGLSESEADRVVDVIQRIRSVSVGSGILLSSHDMKVIRGLASRMMVMERGSVVIEGSVETVMSDPRLAELYLGRRHGV